MDGPQAGQPRLLASTRVPVGIVLVFLLAAFVILYLFPDRTDQLWAWTISPAMTAMAVGAGYLAGVYLFVRAMRDGRGLAILPGLQAAIPFTALLAIATILHWDRFHHAYASFWAWALIYFVTPVVFPVVWVRQRRLEPKGVDGAERRIGPVARVFLVGAGTVLLLAAAVAYVVPSVAIALWPWSLTPLTARTLASFMVFVGLSWAAAWTETRWSALRAPLEATAVGLGLVLLAVPRDWSSMRGETQGWLLVVTLVIILASLVGVIASAHRHAVHAD